MWYEAGMNPTVFPDRHESAVIPGRAEGASPESITTAGEYGFRAPSLRSGPGMTPAEFASYSGLKFIATPLMQ